jgi:transposase
MDARQQRGLAIAAVCKITEKNGFWTVPSQTGNGTYRVCLNPAPFVPQCTCPDYEERKQPCKHVYAVQYVVERESHPDGSETVTETVTASVMVAENIVIERVVAKRKTYKQVWPAYNKAQTTEKDRFQVILHDLCQGIQEPPQEKGRPRAAMRDMVFSAAFKVFSTVSGRRFQCDMDEACKRGHVEKSPRYNTVFKYLEMPGLTPILKAMIAESARPLKSIEVDFSVDSSGFATSRFVRWFDHKYGCPREEYDWVKVSLMTGVKTNVVTAVIVDEKKGGDCPQFTPLVKATAKDFTIREVSADKAYLSYENMDVVAECGGTPYIAFKAGTTAGKGGMLARMFHLFNFNRDEYLSHYHKRSNVESTFSMIKAKFGDSLRSKTDTAMINEALCKVLCHNLCCLIQSHYELGIEAKFWDDEEEIQDVTRQAFETDDMESLVWI